MGKMNELSQTISELKNAAKALINAAESLSDLFAGNGGMEQASGLSVLENNPLTLEDVRAVLAEKSRNGHTAKIRELLDKYGASKLSQIDPSKYPELLAEAEVLGNG
ncbi:MAG: DNA ligase [Peptococcales bacterium]|jgi:hypothetical protein